MEVIMQNFMMVNGIIIMQNKKTLQEIINVENFNNENLYTS